MIPLLQVIRTLENTPGLILIETNYLSVKSFLTGYMMALEQIDNTDWNKNFSDWLNNSKGPQTSLFWSEHIYYMLADENNDKALKLALELLKEYILDPKRD